MIQKVRRKSHRQTFSSMIILSLLTVIGMTIFFIQFQYNPAVLQKDAFLPLPDKESPPSALLPYASFEPLPEGIIPLTPAEIFDPSTLSDKINGKAELYLSAGFASLLTQRFKDELSTDLWLEVFVYDMNNGQNAFSVYSSQRRQDAESLDFAQYAYRTPNALFFVHGRYYLEIITSIASEKMPEPVKKITETFIQNTPVEKAALNETVFFPREKLVNNSIVLISSDAFGYDGFDKIYTAEYELGDNSAMAYLSYRGTPEKAKALVSSYISFLLTYGGLDIEAQLPIEGARLIEILDTYEIVFVHDAYLAGIREAATIDQANSLAMRLYQRLKEGGNEPRP